jgi:hypothetical protein
MAQSKQCPKCSGSMVEGFTVDVTHGSTAVSSWVEGAPQKSIWTGVNLSGRPRTDIASWRCRSCGFLEHYAPATPDRKHEQAQKAQVLLVLAIALGTMLLILGAVLIVRMSRG